MERVKKGHLECCAQGLERFGNQIDNFSKIEESLLAINTAGRIEGHLSYIAGFYKYNGLLHWLLNSDSERAKMDFYIAAKSEIFSSYATNRPHYDCNHKLYVLLSDSPCLIDWYTQDVGALYDLFGKGAQRNKINSFDFTKFNFFLAMQGYFDLLGRRCEYALANPPSKKYQADIIHNSFYLALSLKDENRMWSAISDIVSPKRVRQQNMSGSPQSEFFLSYWATLFTKLAWRNGYELVFDNPWIPMELMPIKPLEKYDEPYEYLKQDIYKTYEGEFEKYSPRRDKKDWLNLEEGSWPPI